MELPVSMETGDDTPAAVTAAKTAAVTAVPEPCLTPDTVMEDRGVDLSFDTTEPARVRVKPELGEVMRTEKLVRSDQIKRECDNSQESAHILQSPGGRLKIFQSKYNSIFYFQRLFLKWSPPYLSPQ